MQPAPVFAASPYLQQHYDNNDSFKATRVYRQLGGQGFIVEKLGGATSQYTGLTPSDILGCLKIMRDEGNAGFLKAASGILGTPSAHANGNARMSSGLISGSSQLHGVFSDLEQWLALIVALAFANVTCFAVVQWIKAARYDAEQPAPLDSLTTGSISVIEHISSTLSSALRAFCCLGCFQLVGSSVLHVTHSALRHVDKANGNGGSSSSGIGGVEGRAWGPWGLLAGAVLVGGGAFGASSVLRMPAVACSGAGAALERLRGRLLAAFGCVLGGWAVPGAGRRRDEGREGQKEEGRERQVGHERVAGGVEL